MSDENEDLKERVASQQWQREYEAAIAELERGNRLVASWWEAYQRSNFGPGGLEKMHEADRIVSGALAKLDEIRSRKPRGGEEHTRGGE